MVVFTCFVWGLTLWIYGDFWVLAGAVQMDKLVYLWSGGACSRWGCLLLSFSYSL